MHQPHPRRAVGKVKSLWTANGGLVTFRCALCSCAADRLCFLCGCAVLPSQESCQVHSSAKRGRCS